MKIKNNTIYIGEQSGEGPDNYNNIISSHECEGLSIYIVTLF